MDLSSLRAEKPTMSAAQRAAARGQGRTSAVKNKSAAAVQITAEQLLREAQQFKEEGAIAPRQSIADPAELREYQARKRKEFEDGIRRNRQNVGLWMRYAAWEAKMDDIARARSIFERALDVDYRNASMWLRYAEMEMRARQVAHARNVWDRAVNLLPRTDTFWYKYAYMEEMMGEVSAARGVFERWMAFHPSEQAWLTYINMEIRQGGPASVERARALYERYTLNHLTLDAYIRYAKFETRHGTVALARKVYERAQEELQPEDLSDEKFYLAFAHFEERNKEYERARATYQYALDHLPKAKARQLYDKYVAFEKSYGDREGVELVILSRRRFQYEEEIKAAASTSSGAVYNYDILFDYLRLEQDHLESVQSSTNSAVNTPVNITAQCARIRDLFERAVSNVPPQLQEKKRWKRYIYLWLEWLVFEECVMRDAPRCREILSKLLSGDSFIPHRSWSFAKLWLHAAHFDLRQGDLAGARKRLGEALGRLSGVPHTKAKILRGYLALELSLGALDRVRTLSGKLVEHAPEASEAWLEFAAFEARLGEAQRARALFELAIAQPVLDQPEKLWKGYIEWELASGEIANVRALYARLLQKTRHVKVWLSSAQFEATQKEFDRARAVFTQAAEFFQTQQAKTTEEERAAAVGTGAPFTGPSPQLLSLKEERLLLLQSWRELERAHGSADRLAAVNKLLPQQLKKRREVATADGGQALEEYYDYVFPEEAAKAAVSGMQFLEKAKAWKRAEEMRKAAEQARLEAEVEREEQEREMREEAAANQQQDSVMDDRVAAAADAQPGASMEE